MNGAGVAMHGEAVSWIYTIEGEFAQDEDVPPEAIVGAWPIDASGGSAGEFIPNPRYVPRYGNDTLPPPDPGWVKA